MSKKQEIAPISVQLPTVNSSILDSFDALVGKGDYLPYIVVAQNDSKWTETEGIEGGDIVMVDNQTPSSLGKEINAVILDLNMKAMKYNGESVTVVTDHTDPRFKEYMDLNKEYKNETDAGGNSYLWGVEFLLFVDDINRPMSLFCNNPTLRRAAKECIRPLLGQFATISAKRIKKGQYRWFGLEAVPCSSPVVNSPSQDDINQWVAQFKATPVVEEAPVDENR